MTLEEALETSVQSNAEDNEVIVIDNDLRKITIPASITLLGVESDENVQTLHFQMPKIYKGLDLSEFAIRINYMNANNVGDLYAVDDNEVSGDNITFTWTVGRVACMYKGNTKFIVCLKKKDASGNVLKEFNTSLASLPVLEGLETTEQVVQENTDIIEQILNKIDGLTSISPEDIATAVEEYMVNNPIEETDPTVPDWAKRPEKPSYTASEVGALPDTTKIPSKTSDLQNDSGFTTLTLDKSLTDNTKAAPAGMVGELKSDLDNKIPSNGEAGQVLMSDGNGGALWWTIKNGSISGEVTTTTNNLIDNTVYVNSGYSGTNQTRYGSNVNVFTDMVDTTENKKVFYRVWRNNKVVNGFCNLKIGCFDADGNYLYTMIDNSGDYSGNFSEVRNTYNIDGIETYNEKVVYCKSIMQVIIPDEVTSIQFAIPGNSNFITDFYTKLFVSFKDILDYDAEVLTDTSTITGGGSPSGGNTEDGTESGSTTVTTALPLAGKSMCIIGDSLTQWGGGGDNTDGFLKVVHDRTGIVITSKALAGATWEEADGQTECGVTRVQEIISNQNSYDCIVFLLGTNVSIVGTVSDTSSTTTTMCGAIRYCIEQMLEYSPTTPMLVCLPPQRAEGNTEQETRNETIKTIANDYGVHCADIFHNSQIVADTKVATGNLTDGLHLNENGKTNIGRILSSEIRYVMGY